jgi:hypothetical protein
MQISRCVRLLIASFADPKSRAMPPKHGSPPTSIALFYTLPDRGDSAEVAATGRAAHRRILGAMRQINHEFHVLGKESQKSAGLANIPET